MMLSTASVTKDERIAESFEEKTLSKGQHVYEINIYFDSDLRNFLLCLVFLAFDKCTKTLAQICKKYFCKKYFCKNKLHEKKILQ